MAENFAVQTLTQADDGVFLANLKMPLLNTLGQPGRRPGDFGLFANTVYVRLADQSVIALGAAAPQTWAQTLALGNVSGPNTPTITAGQSIQFQDGVQIGAFGSAATASADAVGIGALASATGPGAVALGAQATASALSGVALSSFSSASASFALAVGASSTASAVRSAAFGANASATFLNSTALGTNAVTTKNNQVMIGNFPTGGTNEVFFSVGNSGVAWSDGFMRADFCVQASRNADGSQSLPPAAGPNIVNFPTVTYVADYGSPAIDFVIDRLTLRAGYSISGMINLLCTFAPPLAVGVTLVSQVEFDDGVNPPVPVTTTNIVLSAGLSSFSFAYPFRVTPSGVNRSLFVVLNNPSGSTMGILSSTMFTGAYDN
jgi:hypothetical protein